MKLIEALEILRRPTPDSARERRAFLACGFTPLHLQTFLAAELKLLQPSNRITLKTGLFGDLCGNIERLEPQSVDSVAVFLEWGDLDSRLTLRSLGGWRPSQIADILHSATQTAARLLKGLAEISRGLPVVICLPTLPLPPLFSTPPGQMSAAESELRGIVASFAASLARQSRVRIVSAQQLDEVSPLSARYDVKSHVLTAFPYALSHASVLAAAAARAIHDRQPKKGLITDLDDTVWAGILGEDGIDSVSWDLDHHSYMHGLYQQFVASLSEAGVLVAVASKNDEANVDRAFERKDLLLTKKDVFPIEANWCAKSESVRRILKTWNIAADSVVFLDDSPMEVAEVKNAFPEMDCIVFPKSDYQGIWDLLKHLRGIFGKSVLTEEDTIRLNSIRDAEAWKEESQVLGVSQDDFLKGVEACIVFEPVTTEDRRAFELVNKTNQFNLNGKRYTESEWRNCLSQPGTFAFTVSYKDKFGSLGKIAVLTGTIGNKVLWLNSWVMSCRAFSRRIEHQCLKHLFETFAIEAIQFDYQSTPRNSPLQEFLAEFAQELSMTRIHLSKESFEAKVPQLFHTIEKAVHA